MKTEKLLPTIKNPNPYTSYTPPTLPKDPKKPTVLILEGTATTGTHPSVVSEHLKATNPEVNVQYKDSILRKDSPSSSLEEFIFRGATGLLEIATRDFKALATSKDKPDVVNISQGFSPFSILKSMLKRSSDDLYAIAKSSKEKSLFDTPPPYFYREKRRKALQEHGPHWKGYLPYYGHPSCSYVKSHSSRSVH